MKLWIDTEFDGFQGPLISIALIDENGREFYEVLEQHADHPWVKQHVIPVLNKAAISRKDVQEKLSTFVSCYPSIHLIADWPDDIKLFCDLLVLPYGYRLNTPCLTMEIKRELNSEQSCIPHNALEDAKALRALDLK